MRASGAGAGPPAGAPWRRRPDPGAPQIAVIGSGREPPEAPDAGLAAAEEVGRRLARAGANLVCGGKGGVMAAACRGAAGAGGFTIGLLPGADREERNRWVHCAIPTGLGHLRNFLVVRAADGVIALPGGSGTLSEAAMAATLGKPVASLGRPGPVVPGAVAATSPADAVRCVLAAVRDRRRATAGVR